MSFTTIVRPNRQAPQKIKPRTAAERQAAQLRVALKAARPILHLKPAQG